MYIAEANLLCFEFTGSRGQGSRAEVATGGARAKRTYCILMQYINFTP